MKNLLTFFLLFPAITIVHAQTGSSSETLDKDIATHFAQYRPELFRYASLSTYGKALTTFEQNQVEKELQLYLAVRNSGLVNNPTENVFALCHNILIHSPHAGREFLKLLNNPATDKSKIKLLYSEIMFAGEYGEQLALGNLTSGDELWRKTWSQYLSKLAIYESSVPAIEKLLKESNDLKLKEDLIGALMYISDPSSADIMKGIIETTTSDDVQAKAIFAYVELAGNDGLAYVQAIQTKGEKSAEEKKAGIDWLKKETSPKNKFGTEVSNDGDFIMRFGDIKSPAMLWLDKEGLLDERKAKKPTALTKDKKNQLIDLLIESKGFGLEAAKAHLFLSLEPSDIERLLTLRQMCLYSPDAFTQGRLNTIGILVRSLRKSR